MIEGGRQREGNRGQERRRASRRGDPLGVINGPGDGLRNVLDDLGVAGRRGHGSAVRSVVDGTDSRWVKRRGRGESKGGGARRGSLAPSFRG